MCTRLNEKSNSRRNNDAKKESCVRRILNFLKKFVDILFIKTTIATYGCIYAINFLCKLMYIVNRIIVIIISSSIIANYVFVLLYIALLFIELGPT